MGVTLTVATGYGQLIPLRTTEALGTDGLWEVTEKPEYNLLDYDMAYYHDYYPDDEAHQVIFVKSTVTTTYGARVTTMAEQKTASAEEIDQLRRVSEELGIKPKKVKVGYWTVVSVG